ncbi:phage repressor protein C with HTH and peptisase S24 domain [Nicoletella semolina]|uniref:Phage repressor protein C with HTH and peptisase S24 domain n=1 Tax=Nicoletella semolina TaxID=271160 RepID=A0A4R2NAS6_9PAST|nr:S24 family peptidase [Nicoletella semolina]MDH2923962.1 repressor [Nicoletella semolina]TCP18085.1 phage repressor protein C with HTH and peptisase S24 domain [Nicoletella semolina]
MKRQWSELVREKMAEKNLKQDDLAEALDKTQGAIGHWLTGKRKPNFDDVAKMLGVVGVERVMLNSDGLILLEDEVELAGKPKEGLIRVLGEAVMGADGEFEISEELMGFVRIYSSDKEAYCLRVKGNSMEPRILSGEFVVIEPNTEIYPGDEVFVRTNNGKNMIKVMDYCRDGEYRFSSINKAHDSFTLDYDEVNTVASVAAIVKRSRFISLEEIPETEFHSI